MAGREPSQQGTNIRAGRIALVLVVTMGLWLVAQNLGGRLGWDVRLAFLFDLAALAGFAYALFGTYRIWRQRRDN